MNIQCISCDWVGPMRDLSTHRLDHGMGPYITGADSEVPGWNFGDRSVAAVMEATFTPDAKDIDLLGERQARRLDYTVPMEGDYVEFSDGVTRRMSHVWPDGVQTSDGGSWHISDSGYGSFSGGLYPSVHRASLTLTDELRHGAFWFFHHAWAKGHNAIHCQIAVRVWRCSLPAPR